MGIKKIHASSFVFLYIILLAAVSNIFAAMQPIEKTGFEFLPIIMWDTDIGFGYGIKMFLLNQLKTASLIHPGAWWSKEKQNLP